MRYPLANAQGFSCYVEAYNDIDVAHWTKNIYTCRDQYIDIKLSHLHLCTLIPSSVGFTCWLGRNRMLWYMPVYFELGNSDALFRA